MLELWTNQTVLGMYVRISWYLNGLTFNFKSYLRKKIIFLLKFHKKASLEMNKSNEELIIYTNKAESQTTYKYYTKIK